MEAVEMEVIRQKVLAGTVTKEELSRVYAAMREKRLMIPTAIGGSKVTKAAKAPAKKATVNADDLLAGLGQLPLLPSP